MVKVRPRKTTKANWTMDQLTKAIKLIDEEGYTMRKAALAMNIPFSSLHKRYKKTNKKPRLGRTTVFTPEIEQEFASTVKNMSNLFYGCTATQVRKAAFDYAESLNLKHNFNKQSKMAGRVWFEGFTSRNNISIRKPEATSIHRITAFNKTEVHRFYQLLEEIMARFKFQPKNIYNCDETGISTVQEPGKVLATKGQKRVGSITSWERGKNVTLLCAMSAAGGYVPPMFIFPRKRMTPTLEKGGLAGAIYRCSDSGWINEDLFLGWLEHFNNHAKPSENEPVLLILDNHASHISLAIHEYCKTNHIHMLSLPPHTSHRMQPLDVSFFGPFKAAYKRECDFFMKSHLAERITPYDLASLVKKAFSDVATISKGEAGFKATGIFPLNPNVFTDEDFVAAEVLQSEPNIVEDVDPTAVQPSAADFEQHSPPIPSTSRDFNQFTPEHTTVSTSTPELPLPITTKIQDFIQMPKKTLFLKTRQGRKKQHATLLTSTPIKDTLIEKENKKKAKNEKVKGKGIGKKSKPTAVLKATAAAKVKKRILRESNESSSSSEVKTDDLCQDDINDDVEDTGNQCLICGEFGKDNEMWYRCTSCGLWAHSECTGWESARNYVCDNC